MFVVSVLHVFFHGINLYHICTQPSTDLNCYLREYFRAYVLPFETYNIAKLDASGTSISKL